MLQNLRLGAAALLMTVNALMLGNSALGESTHAISMYGQPALSSDFEALPYAHPDAPKGGRIVFGFAGNFDSLNPWILKGRAPWEIRTLVYEPLMGRNWDEPFSLYGLLAETVETDDNRTWVEFTIREEARFSDGTPVTVEDVIWSFETLGTKGHPRYRTLWQKVASIEQTGERAVRITFSVADRELPLIAGLRPILPKSHWQERDFERSSLERPVGSGPYLLGKFDTGRFVEFKRNPDYWGKDLAFNRGRHNFDTIRYEYYGDAGVVFEAFKAGEFSSYREWSDEKWHTQYNFPASNSGEIVKSEIAHSRPSGIRGWVFNTRREFFQDWRVRDALIHAFNYEFISRTVEGGRQPRIRSYFSNSELGMQTGPATGHVLELLQTYEGELLPGAIEGYELPVSDGSERNRANLRTALDKFADAGWTIDERGDLRNGDGDHFSFEILLVQGAFDANKIATIYTKALERIGIKAAISVIDSAQYRERTNNYDFDMAWYSRGMSLSPGNEQYLYWGRDGVTRPGSRNWMGMDNPAVEGMIEAMLQARQKEEFISAVRALDRVLTTGRYVIPLWYSKISRIAHQRELKYPEYLPIYGDWIGFQPDVWWYEEE